MTKQKEITCCGNTAMTDCKALVAATDGLGLIVCHHGEAFEFELRGDEPGLYLEDLSLKFPGEGLFIWEGRLAIYEVEEEELYADTELIGEYRRLSDEEWTLLKDTGVPWDPKLERDRYYPAEKHQR